MKNIFVAFLACMLISVTDPIEFTIPSTITNGYWVGKIKASDPDGGQSLTWSIVDGNTKYNAFRINASTGDLYVNNADYIKTRKNLRFYLIVRVTDSGGYNKNHKFVKLSAQATITIKVFK